MHYPTLPRERYARRPCSSSPTFPAATRGSFRRATTRTSASAGGRARARSSASTCARLRGARPRPRRARGAPRAPAAAAPARTRIAGERALLVGDAAGLIDPVSGDGMYECFVSSRLATAAILDLLAGRASTSRPTRAPSTASSPRCTVPRGSSRRRSTAGRALLAGRAHEAPLGQHPRDARG